jgi:hypothetical protein
VRFGAFADTQNLPLKALFPVAALLLLLVLAHDWRTSVRDRLLRSCAVFGFAGFVGCFPRPDITHIAFAAPLAVPLLACCATRLTQQLRPAIRYMVGAVVIVLCAPSALFFLLLSQQALCREIVPTPRGSVAFFEQPGIRELLVRIAATPRSDAYFFYPYMPMLPFLTNREHVSKYDIFVPGYTMPAQYQNACLSAVRHASWVVIDKRWTDPDLLRVIFPAMRDADPQETKAFEKALDDNFELVAQEGSFELRRRRGGINEAVCSKITE